ncbi:hypothetical protein FKM82_003959 [Ascaphus truei]
MPFHILSLPPHPLSPTSHPILSLPSHLPNHFSPSYPSPHPLTFHNHSSLSPILSLPYPPSSLPSVRYAGETVYEKLTCYVMIEIPIKLK